MILILEIANNGMLFNYIELSKFPENIARSYFK